MSRFEIEKLEERIAPAGLANPLGGKPDPVPPVAPGADGAGVAHGLGHANPVTGAEHANCHAPINDACS